MALTIVNERLYVLLNRTFTIVNERLYVLLNRTLSTEVSERKIGGWSIEALLLGNWEEF